MKTRTAGELASLISDHVRMTPPAPDTGSIPPALAAELRILAYLIAAAFDQGKTEEALRQMDCYDMAYCRWYYGRAAIEIMP